MGGTPLLNVQARAACTRDREVWLALQKGGIAIHDSQTRRRLAELSISTDGKTVNQVRHLTPVNGSDVWVATADGELLCIDAAARTVVATLRLPGAERKAALSDMSFVSVADGGSGALAVASAAGRVFLIDPAARGLVQSLSTLAPCTAVVHCFHSLVVAGDEDGALYVWDLAAAVPTTPGAHLSPATPACARPIIVHRGSGSKVRRILFEPETEALWVARENGNIDVYAMDPSVANRGLALERRATGVGLVTDMLSVGAKVVVTTFEKRVVTLNAESAAVVSAESDAHQSFLHGVVAVTRTEKAELWTVGNDERVRSWEVEGFTRAANRTSRFPARARAALAFSPLCSLLSDNAKLGVATEEAKAAALVSAESMRKAREEAHELQLRLAKVEKVLDVKDAEVAAKTKRIQELEAAQAKLQKDVTDIASKVAIAERERAALQADLTKAREETTQARTDASHRSVEKSKADEELSRQQSERQHMEQRLRDTESKLASVQAENARLCQSMGNVATTQNAEKEVQNRILQSSAQVSQELQDAQRLNRVLSSVVASMEYTIRRKVEEEKDIVALLNAYRRKAADHVTDPFLSALLIATMVRLPERFDLECDEVTKAALLDRNSSFIQFVHALRQAEPEAYEKLMDYLQQCTTAAGEGSLSPESRHLLDELVSLAGRDGGGAESAVLALTRSIPATVSAASPTGGVSGVGLPSPATAAAVSGAGGGGGSAAQPTAGSLVFPGMTTIEPKAGEDPTSATLLRELRSQRAVEDSYVKEHRAMFEFILKTRRALVECLALLLRRTMSAQQVAEALTANAAAAGQAASATLSSSSPATSATPTKGARLLPHQTVFVSMIRELAELTASVVSQYLTDSEKQRLNVQ